MTVGGKKKPNLEKTTEFKTIVVEWEEISSDSDLEDEDAKVRRNAHLRREGKRTFIRFTKYLRSHESRLMRLAYRPGIVNNKKYPS